MESASPGTFLEMQIFKHHLSVSESETLEMIKQSELEQALEVILILVQIRHPWGQVALQTRLPSRIIWGTINKITMLEPLHQIMT